MLAILGGSEHCIATHTLDFAVALTALDATLELRGENDARRTVKCVTSIACRTTRRSSRPCLHPGELIDAIAV